jgi:ubiquinone/menaquinone biosynthesis C-methylase UbiE
MGLYADYLFAPLMDWSLSRPAMNELRQRVVEPAAGRVLEIGFGTGLNLPFYKPQVTSLTLLDRAMLLPGRVKQRTDACAARIVSTTQASAERLPFPDLHFDCVVSTFALCTIGDPAAALAEVKRVLAPRGRLLFAEHGRSDSRWLARWQDRLNGVQRLVGCGCNLNRPILSLLDQAGLRIVDLDRSPLAGMPALMSMYVGQATHA